jgi:hypothetical protein
LKADVGNLGDIGDTITATDLNIPESLEFIHEEVADYPIATIQPFQKTLEEEKKEEEEAAAAAGEVEELDEEGAEAEGDGDTEGEAEGEEATEGEAEKSEDAPEE